MTTGNPPADGDVEASAAAPEVAPDTDAAELTPEDDDPWAAALAEQQTASQPEPDEPAARSETIFKPLDERGAEGTLPRELEIVMDIPVKLNVELGRTRITIKQLLELAQGSVVELDGLAGDPMDILINGYLIAQGEVVVVDDKYGIRITDIITPSERVQKLNR
ncbi:MAG: flagellar motor switch protein FliN [Pseudomonas sp.]